MGKDANEKVIELEIENMKYVIELMEKIKPVIKQFDGKVLNKRLETKLQEIDRHIHIANNDTDRFYITVSFAKINILTENHSYLYVKQREMSLTSYEATKNEYKRYYRNVGENTIFVTDENNRIIADELIRSIDKQKEYIEKEINELETGLLKVNEYKERMENLKKEFEILNREIPYLIKQHINELNHYLR